MSTPRAMRIKDLSADSDATCFDVTVQPFHSLGKQSGRQRLVPAPRPFCQEGHAAQYIIFKKPWKTWLQPFRIDDIPILLGTYKLMLN
ncbi:hypothetical protein D3C87_1840930 [compost metagenome]